MRKSIAPVVAAGLMLALSPIAYGSFHTWDTNEIFSNADGTIQFVEMREAGGSNNQHFFNGRYLTTTAVDYVFPGNLPNSSTANRFMLLATPGFAALPGAPTPDYMIPPNFFAVSGDTIRLRSTATGQTWDTFNFGAVPIDGVLSLNRNLTTGTNSPTNYAGVSGSVTVGAATPPAVPDGVSGAAMRAEKLTAGGSQLRLTFDTTTCTDADDHQIVFSGGSDLPAVLGGTYAASGFDGSVCAIGTVSPYDWIGVPDPTLDGDPSDLIWWLILATDGSTTEGSWGRDGSGAERDGPGGGGGNSGQCAVTDKDLSNSCGL